MWNQNLLGVFIRIHIHREQNLWQIHESLYITLLRVNAEYRKTFTSIPFSSYQLNGNMQPKIQEIDDSNGTHVRNRQFSL